jgi:hypothetical protein
MSEEMEYNHKTVKKSATSVSNNNSSGYGKSENQQSVEKVRTGTNNVNKLCNSIASKNKNYLNKGV